ncbi:MAG: leucyl aminopeptidase [Thermaerobacter sp.]|nr:leucyl aminopeptidase [Thermaerobacter sp.]
METKLLTGQIQEVAADALVVGCHEGAERLTGAAGAVDRALNGALSELLVSGELGTKPGEVTLLHTLGRIVAPRVLVVGLGPPGDLDGRRVREVAAAAARTFLRLRGRRLATVAHGAREGGLTPEQAAGATVEGTLLGLYRFSEYKQDPRAVEPETLLLVERDPKRAAAYGGEVAAAQVLARRTNEARSLVNRPARDLTPGALAALARQAAEGVGLEVQVLEREDLERLGMQAFLGVARGSAEPPRMIVLRHRGGGAKTLALVGKGLTFDSGGLSLKTAEGMEDMKTDMAGGAAVLGAMLALAELAVPLEVVGIIPATENMPGGRAQKPGDVVRTAAGKTVEVANTDAEGRLVLADALHHARSFAPDWIVDIATLTGACVVALGHQAAGLLANDDELARKVRLAAERAGERVWPLPAYPEYKEQLKSEVADLKNIGGRPAGAITGGLFVGEFAGELPWAHLDIAGTAWNAKERASQGVGATGTGVRTLVRLAQLLAEGGAEDGR